MLPKNVRNLVVVALAAKDNGITLVCWKNDDLVCACGELGKEPPLLVIGCVRVCEVTDRTPIAFSQISSRELRLHIATVIPFLRLPLAQDSSLAREQFS